MIDPYVTKFPCKTGAYVSLSPEKAGDYSKVKNISADFLISCP
jgi:hypothetical protein